MTIQHPLREGVIADLAGTQKMLKAFVDMIRDQISWIRPRLIISLPCKVTDFEKKAVEEVGYSLGARKVHLIEEPVAAALGSDMPIMESTGNMIVDIGGGTTEIAIISCGGIIYSNAIRVAGHDMDQKILDYIRQKYNFMIGEQTAEQLKIEIGSAIIEDNERELEVKGQDLASGLPRKLKIKSTDVSMAISESVRAIIQAIRYALEQAPPEISADLSDRGLMLAGGGALLKNLPERIRRETGMQVNVSQDPLLSIMRGGAKALEDEKVLQLVEI